MLPLTAPFAEIINKQCDILILPHELVLAIVMVESEANPWVTRHEPNWKYFVDVEGFAARLKQSQDTERVSQATSYGLMQIMGGRARELGFKSELTRLLSPELGVEYGCKHLASCYQRFGQLDDSAIAAYNAGSPRRGPDGKFVNQDYVDKVNEHYKKILFDEAHA